MKFSVFMEDEGQLLRLQGLITASALIQTKPIRKLFIYGPLQHCAPM
jgi:hypothetical protein